MGDLAADTEVKGSDGEYQATLSRDWEIWGPNGGYVAAIALRGAGAHSRFDRPANMVGHFLGVGSFDTPLDIRVTTLRAAKRAESLRVELTQGDQRIFEALVWAVGDVAGLAYDRTQIPTTSDPNTLPSNRERLEGRADVGPYHRFWSNFDERVSDDDWIDDWENRPPSAPLTGGWFRFVPASTFADPWVDACRSVILLDTLGWPAVCRLHTRPEYMAPSIDLACAFHRLRPDEPWLYAQARAESAADGLIGCDAKVWAADGTLVAVGASQLLCRPWPSS
jgi:acyl-CoA thioesterase-2